MIDVTEQEIRKDGQRQGVPMEFTEAMIWAWKEGKISPVERDETDLPDLGA